MDANVRGPKTRDPTSSGRDLRKEQRDIRRPSQGIRYLDFDEVVLVHRRIIERTGGNPSLPPENEGQIRFCLDSIEYPVFGHDPYPSLFEKAAYLLYFIIERHPFVDGNKRSATAIAAYFLEKNDYVLELHGMEGYALALEVGDGKVALQQLVDWIRRHVTLKEHVPSF